MHVARERAQGPAAVLKAATSLVAVVLTLPFVGLFRLAAALAPSRSDSFFQGYSQLFSLWPGMSGDIIRRAFYRQTLRDCSAECTIGFGTVFATTAVDLAEGVYIGLHGNIGHATIARDTLLGSNVTILSGRRQHHIERLDVPVRLQGGTYERVRIGIDVWIGNGAIVSCDVGDHAVVAAGAIVVHPVPPRAIVGGNPAKVIGWRGPGAGGTPVAGDVPVAEHHPA